MVTSVEPRLLAILAKLCRRTCAVTSDSGESLKDVLPMVREVAEHVVSMRWEDVGVDIVVAPSL